MPSILVSWIGITDIKAAEPNSDVGLGPIAQAVKKRSFEHVELVTDFAKLKIQPFIEWLRQQSPADINLHFTKLPGGPTDYEDIYKAAEKTISEVLEKYGTGSDLVFHLSSGTPAMASVWIILGKTRFPAELIESSKELGVRTASIPFEISAEYIPSLLSKSDQHLERLFLGLPPEAPEFDHIIHRSKPMQRVIAMARRAAPRSIPILLEGATGTGKELLARAIHRASPRTNFPFVTVNCGAIPPELVESEFFGHKKGSFTGAIADRVGHFESAHKGTLFLDEVGELPLAAQVKLLRAIQEGEILRIGESRPKPIDVRILSATNCTLLQEVNQGKFREDLYYRLAVAVLRVPPLKDRPGDLTLLIDYLMEKINQESASEPGYQHKKLSTSARSLLLKHNWPGNVRELQNTLRRAAVWCSGGTIDSEHIHHALLSNPSRTHEPNDVLSYSLDEPINLQAVLHQVARHYLQKALQLTHGNKTKAAQLLGLPNYQTFSNWLKRYEVKS